MSEPEQAAAPRSSRRSSAEADPWRPRRAEKALLVAVELTGGPARRVSATVRQAREAARLQRREGDGWAEDLLLGGDMASPGETAEGVGDRSEESTLEGGDAAALTFEAHVAEFEELARSAGATVVTTLRQRRIRADAATLVGSGKVEEIEAVALSSEADVVLFDRDLTPSQLRNLESKLPCRVIDRTQLILDIFARHARTREGHLQVELAQLEYQLPRLAGRGRSMSQLGGGIGTRGPGETKLETDRRRINARIDHLKAQLESVRRIRRQQRQRREAVPVPVVALVGYTNAGKSTLFNALTEAGVLESARMFATLDPKLRQLRLPSRRKILLSDTVGFIADLPPSLVSSFRATLEEVERAELLLHVQDAASPTREEQRREVLEVLRELEVEETPILEVLNKADLLPEGWTPEERDAVAVSGLRGTGLEELLERVDGLLTRDPLLEVEMRVPQSDGRTMAAVEAGGTVEAKRFEGNLAYLRVVGPTSLLQRYRRYFVRDGAEGQAQQS